MWREVEGVLFVEDRFSREELARSLVQVLQPNLVGGQKNDGVSVKARRSTARLENCFRSSLRGVVGLLDVGMIYAENHESRVKIVRHISTGARHWMHAFDRRAAKHLSVSEPALSQQVGDLENELG